MSANITNLPYPKGGTATAFVYTQAVPAGTWTIAHNLGHNPAGVTIYGTDTLQRFAPLSNPDVNTTVITFASAQAGSAVLI